MISRFVASGLIQSAFCLPEAVLVFWYSMTSLSTMMASNWSTLTPNSFLLCCSGHVMGMFGPFCGNPTRIWGILFCIEWFSKNSLGEEWGSIKCLLSILSGACLFLWKKDERVEVKTASFSFPITSLPAAPLLYRCFVNTHYLFYCFQSI